MFLYDTTERRRCLRACRQRDFRRRQSRQRMMFAFLLSMAALTIQSPVRSMWMKSRSNSWWEDVVNAILTSDNWFENLRMSKATFLYVCDKLRSSVEKNDTAIRKAIPVKQRVALNLWFLSTGADYHTIGHLLGVSKSAVCVITKQVCNALVAILIATKVHTIPQW